MRKVELIQYIEDRFTRITSLLPEITFLKFPECGADKVHFDDLKEAYKWLRTICTGPLKEYTVLKNAQPDEAWEEFFTHHLNFEEVKILKAARHQAFRAITKMADRPKMLRKSYGKAKPQDKGKNDGTGNGRRKSKKGRKQSE